MVCSHHIRADELGLSIIYRYFDQYNISRHKSTRIAVNINVSSDYLRPLVVESFAIHPSNYELLVPNDISKPNLQWDEYENLDWKTILQGKVIANSYCIRKGLSRKAQLSLYLNKYISKVPTSCLKKALPRTVIIDTWDAFNSDLALLGIGFRERMNSCLFDIKHIFEEEEKLGKKIMWILKPSATNKGAEVNVILSFKALQSIIYEWTDIREWVIQEYVQYPLLLNSKKFHIRAYILALGSLQVFVYQDVLILTAMEKFNNNLTSKFSHITNTVLQQDHPNFSEEECVLLLEDLVKSLLKDGVHDAKSKAEKILKDIGLIIADMFLAYKGEFSVFQPLPNCFEIYGADFLVDENFNVWLLEMNPGPDFKQTGKRLYPIIASLIKDSVNIITNHFFSNDKNLSTYGRYSKVLNELWGDRAKSSISMNYS